jgi:hypothetical protein
MIDRGGIMATYRFGALEMDPVANPAVLDKATWDIQHVGEVLSRCTLERLEIRVIDSLNGNISEEFKFFLGSHVNKDGMDWYLCKLKDGQYCFISLGVQNETVLEEPFFKRPLDNRGYLCAYEATDKTVYRYIKYICPLKGPRPLGTIPRLGIGNRHSVTLWPGIWKAIGKKHFAANAIQNSVRELFRLETLLNGEPAKENHLYSFGKIKEGHTGSTFEGLWVSGVISALESSYKEILYGADADHLQVKRGTEGTSRTKKYLDSARYYTFYTIDVSDILDYHALTSTPIGEVIQKVEAAIPKSSFRNELIAFHRSMENRYALTLEMVQRYLCKYWYALEAMEELDEYLRALKNGEKYDLELSIDETPADFDVFKAITSNEELQFLINEIRRRKIAITHIAPNFGVEKGMDYRAPGGLKELERRVSDQVAMAVKNGFMLDCHSGDDLSRETRKTFGRASQGNIHFKVSPMLQIIYAETLEEMNPKDFSIWWNDTLSYAEESAAQGSTIAIESLRLLTEIDYKKPSSKHLFFREYCFATVGKRNEVGNFLFRPVFYSQSEAFQTRLDEKIEKYLTECSEDLWG